MPSRRSLMKTGWYSTRNRAYRLENSRSETFTLKVPSGFRLQLAPRCCITATSAWSLTQFLSIIRCGHVTDDGPRAVVYCAKKQNRITAGLNQVLHDEVVSVTK